MICNLSNLVKNNFALWSYSLHYKINDRSADQQINNVLCFIFCLTQNIKDTLKSTLDALYSSCHLEASRDSISKSSKVFRVDLKFLRKKLTSSSKRSRPLAVFKKRVYVRFHRMYGSKACSLSKEKRILLTTTCIDENSSIYWK